MKNLILYMSLVLTLAIGGCSSKNEETTKSNAPLEDTRWGLKTLLDKKVFLPESGKDVFIMFKADGNKYSGNGGCNNFFGTFKKNGNSISFGLVASTEMYCESMMDTESNFFKALQRTNKYKIKGNNLFLYSNDSLLAKFDAIYLR